MKNTTFLFWLAAILLCTLLPSCSKSEGEVISRSKQDVTPEEEAIIGATIQQSILDQSDFFEVLERDRYEEEYAYMEQLLHMITNTTVVENRKYFSWTVHILVDDEVRTMFATPGGHLFIYTGMLKFLRSESELLAIMAHEVMYVDKGLISTALINDFGGDQLGDILLGRPSSELKEMAKYLPFITYSQQTVMAADSFAIEVLCPFLYDPLGIEQVLANAEQNSVEEYSIDWLRVRPGSREDRIGSLYRLAKDCDDFGKRYVERYQRFRAKLP